MAYISFQPQDYFTTHLYSGNDTTNNQQVGLTPDLVWVKCRNSAVPSHYIVDKVRGNEKYISSNATTAEQTDGNTFELVSGGFNLAGGNGWTNLTGRTYASWNWKANGTGSSNTDGSITSTVSANTTAGFSIVKWTGTGSNPSTVGHGLGAVPKFIITKRISGDTASWHTYHASIGNAYDIYLNGTNPQASDTSWNSTTPTSSVFTVNGANVNVSGAPYIAYVFAEKTGFSKFGSYTGAGSNLPFIYTGFKPAFVMIKRSSNTDNWYMKDNKRSGTAALQNFGQMNPNQTQHPSANNNNAENKASDFATDILSNGFKFRGTDSGINQSGETYIYMAFAEAPLVGSNNVPCTAR